MTTNSDVTVAFIAGWGRSGSTLLERMLARTDGFVSVGEMRDIWQRGWLENRLCGCGEPFRMCEFWSAVGQRAFGGWDTIDAAALMETRRAVDGVRYLPWLSGRIRTAGYARRVDEYASTLHALYDAIAAVAGARVVVDSSKIPTYALLLRQVHGLRVRAVHLVRDSRGVVFSWQKEVARTDSTADSDYMRRYSTVGASLRYTGHNLIAESLPRLGIPSIDVRYEDLVKAPAATVDAIVRHIDPDATPPDLLTDGDAVTLAANHSVDGNPMRFQRGPVVLRQDVSWKTRMRAADIWAVTAMTYPLLRHYGYAVDARSGTEAQ